MKTLVYYLIFIFLNFHLVSFAQTYWTKYPGNPIFNPGPSGSWDDAWVSWPFVIHDGTQFIMYYTGFPAVSPFGGQVGRATSPDGIDWTREGENPVLIVGSGGDWDDATVFSGPVIFDGSEYKMWYVGYDGTYYRIGLATSPDGIDWTTYDENPVFDPGDSGQWDDRNVAVSSVIFDESVYKMWYVGRENATGIWRVGYATSHDGITWDRYANNPVLDIGKSGEWDDEDIQQSYVLFNGNRFEMWYQGSNGIYVRSGYATSPDGMEWTKYAGNPILVTEGGWETRVAGINSVILKDSEYRAWYMGETSSTGRIGYATSPVVINVPDQVETIQAAIDSAVDGNLVLVDEGTYYENINFKGKAITVASRLYVDGDTSHISKTIIDGSQHTNPDSGSVVYFVSGEDTNSVLYGFTITGGSGTKGDWEGNVTWDGGGIYSKSGGRIINNIVSDNGFDVDVFIASGGGILAGWLGTEYVIIQDNTISSNSITNNDECDGGGIAFYCNGKITMNTIMGNTTNGKFSMGGGLLCWSSINNGIFINVDIYGNKIENNRVNVEGSGDIRGFGGGIHYVVANGNISNNTIRNNSIKSDHNAYGGGIFINASQSTTIANNLIEGNSVEGSGIATTIIGGGICYISNYVAGKTTIYNNIITYNESINGNGGGISFGSDLNNDASVFNNTIAYNKAGIFGGGIATSDFNSGVMFNSILWGNEAQSNSQIYLGGGSTLTVLYSDIQSGFSGEKNIDQDPLFEDTVEFKLSNSSPCIGAGIDSIEFSETWYYCPDHGYHGEPRPIPIGSAPDMGACESPLGTDIESEEFHMPLTFKLSQNYPNPFNPITIINYELPITNNVKLSIYNLLGQKVATLVSEKQNPGYHQVQWDASGFASGVYYYSIKAGKFQDVKKMILLR